MDSASPLDDPGKIMQEFDTSEDMLAHTKSKGTDLSRKAIAKTSSAGPWEHGKRLRQQNRARLAQDRRRPFELAPLRGLRPLPQRADLA